MSAVMFIRDPDPARRGASMRAAEAAMGRLDLSASSLEHGEVGVVWGAFAGAPVGHAPGVFVLGDLIAGPGPERLTARAYGERCAGSEIPPAFDGYHYAATFDAQGALTVAVDILGSFPLYHAAAGDALLVGSSPALIAACPAFRAELDPLGLAGILVSNGAVRGRTAYRGIRRLAAGHVLVAAPGGAAREVRHHAIEIHAGSHDVPVEESALRVYEAFTDAARRHVPNDEPHTMLLSGGLDSRLICGILARQGAPLNVITRGIATDLEYRCARTVARRLGLEHHLVPHRETSFEHFERSLWWDGLSAAPGSGGSEGLGESRGHSHPRVVAGYLADSLIGGGPAAKTFDRAERRASPERLIRRLNAWGVPFDVLTGLLRKDVFGDGVQVVQAEMRADIVAAGPTDLSRSWIYDMAHRQRFVMGRTWGRLAFGAWPRSPQVDRALIRVVAGVPLPVLTGRRLEREILERFHTELARLPLDRNDPDTTPMLPGVADLVRAGIDRRIRAIRRRLGVPRPERRYYHRTFDFNGPAWRIARHGAEADRERLHALFDVKALDAFLPRAAERWQPTGQIEGAAGVKMLTALAVWMRAALG